MDIPKIVASMILIPWAWILLKIVTLGDFSNVFPMAILGFLLYKLESAIRKQNLAKSIENRMNKDSSSQTRNEYSENFVQDEQENVDNCIEKGRIHIGEVATQSKTDTFTRMESKEFDVKEAQALCPITDDKKGLCHKPKEEFELSSTLFSKKKSCMKSESSKRVPSKQRKVKFVIPPTDDFHKEKYSYKRKIKILPKLELTLEVYKNANEFVVEDLFASEDVILHGASCLSIDEELGPETTEMGEKENKKYAQDIKEERKIPSKSSLLRKRFKTLKKFLKK